MTSVFSPRLRRQLIRLALVVGSLGGAGALIALLGRTFPEEQDSFLFLFVLPTGLAAYYWGLAGGVLITLLALLVAQFPPLIPITLFTASSAQSQPVVATFAAVALISTLVTNWLRAATRAERLARAEAEATLARLRELHQVTEATLTKLPVEEMVRELLTRIKQILGADTVAMLLLDGSGKTLVAQAAVGLEGEVKRGMRIPVGRGFAGKVVATGQPVFLDDVPHEEVLNPVLREKGVVSLLGVPLQMEGRVLGVLHVGTLAPRRFTGVDIQILQLAADRVAPAVENARLYEEAQHRAASLGALIDVATGIHEAVRIEDVMRAVAESAQRLAGGGAAFAGFFRGRGEPDPTEYRQWQVAGVPRRMFEHLDHLHITPLFEPTFRAKATVRADDVRHHPLFHALPEGHVPVVSYLAVPIVSRLGRSLGAILLGHPEPGKFDEHVQGQVESLARQASVALENALLYEREHGMAETLQRSLLPDRLPDVPGIAFAVRYLPSGTGEVGGDWYDVLELTSGNVALAMGDVVGRGVSAAAVMGQIRNALRAYALEDPSPRSVVSRLNTLTHRFSSPNLVTLVYLLLDTSRATVRYCRAGHLPPLLVRADGTSAFLTGGHTLPLGVVQDLPASEGEASLPSGSTLLLFTDGLVDHPGVPLEAALARLRDAAGATDEPGLEPMVDRVLASALEGSSRLDDVALLGLYLVPQGSRLHLRLPAEPRSVAAMRQALRRWCGEQGLSDEETFRLLVATGEAAGNVIEHAYGPGGGPLEVEAVRRDDTLFVCVRDYGRWRPARGEERGRGLRLMTGLVDQVAVSHEGGGTEIQMTQRVRRAAVG